jgi:hypothetical protein
MHQAGSPLAQGILPPRLCLTWFLPPPPPMLPMLCALCMRVPVAREARGVREGLHEGLNEGLLCGEQRVKLRRALLFKWVDVRLKASMMLVEMR